MANKGHDDQKCGFCGASQNEVTRLIQGLDSNICDSCIEECAGLIEEQKLLDQKKNAKDKKKLDKPTPSQIKKHLDQYVVGQENAKKILSVAVYNHYKRVGKQSDTGLQKSNVLIIGPTGSGKTYLVETIAKYLDVPFAQADATTMTEAGYVGEDVESVLVRLVQNSDNNIKKAEHGIVYIDEIDKIAVSENGSRGRDVSGEGVQQGLLKMLEGSVVSIYPEGKRQPGPPSLIDTRNILFICGGAFGKALEEKVKGKKQLGIGFGNDFEDVKKDIPKMKHKDLIKFGMIPEFMGRLPVLAQLAPLSVEDMVKILVEPKNALTKQYQELFEMDGVNLKFTQDFLEEVANRANSEGTGARGLKAIMEPVLNDLMFRVPDEEVEEIEVTKDLLEQT